MNPNFDFRPIRSRNLSHVAYDLPSRTLAVRFKSGNEYHFEGVSPEKHAALLSAPSAGGFFMREIQNAHRSRKSR